MNRFFFHTQAVDRVADEDGVELPTRRAAREMAMRIVGDLMKDGVTTFWDTKPWKVSVTDSVGLILFEIEVHGHAAPAFPD